MCVFCLIERRSRLINIMHCVFSHSIQNVHVKGVYSKAFYIAMPPTDKNGERYENYSLAEAKYVKTNHPLLEYCIVLIKKDSYSE